MSNEKKMKKYYIKINASNIIAQLYNIFGFIYLFLFVSLEMCVAWKTRQVGSMLTEKLQHKWNNKKKNK